MAYSDWLTVDSVKDHLDIDHANDDDKLALYRDVAGEILQSYMNLSIVASGADSVTTTNLTNQQKMWMILAVSQMYEQRLPITKDSLSTVPFFGLNAMLMNIRKESLTQYD